MRSAQPMQADYFCARCRTPFMNDSALDTHGVCRLCRSGATGFDYVYSYGYYDGPLRSMIHALKYKAVHPLGKFLGELMARAFPLDLTADLIVPVPVHWARRFVRGFNQAELLARPLAHRLRVPIVNAIKRKRYTRSQIALSPSQRRKNLKGVFAVRDRSTVAGKRVLLVDDVLTTGATVGQCTKALRDAGAKSVTVLTLARVDRRPAPPSVILTAKQASGGANR